MLIITEQNLIRYLTSNFCSTGSALWDTAQATIPIRTPENIIEFLKSRYTDDPVEITGLISVINKIANDPLCWMEQGLGTLDTSKFFVNLTISKSDLSEFSTVEEALSAAEKAKKDFAFIRKVNFFNIKEENTEFVAYHSAKELGRYLSYEEADKAIDDEISVLYSDDKLTRIAGPFYKFFTPDNKELTLHINDLPAV